MKSIEEIKEEVAKEHIESGERSTIEQLLTEVAKRHAQQYIDANKELVEMLEYVYNFSKGMHFHKGSITDQEISNLIAKHTTHDKGKEESC